MKIDTTKHSRRGTAGIAVRLTAVLLVAGAAAACDLDRILAVHTPGQVLAQDLERPALAAMLGAYAGIVLAGAQRRLDTGAQAG